MEDSLTYLKKALQIKRLLSYILEDLIQSRSILLLSFLFALILLVIYMFLLRYLARWMIWISLLLCITVFALATTFCFNAWFRLEKPLKNDNPMSSDLQQINITFDTNDLDRDQSDSAIHIDEEDQTSSTLEKFDKAMVLLEDFAPMRVIWLTFGILCCIICVVLMICVCCLCERISLAASRTFLWIFFSLESRFSSSIN